MQLQNRNIITEVARLNMPHPEDIVIGHGAALVIRGLRAEHTSGDIDIITCQENIDYLQQSLGFSRVSRQVSVGGGDATRTVISHHDQAERFDVHSWDFSLHRYNLTGSGDIHLAEAKTISDQDKETGIWVAKEAYLLLTKQGTGRPQDEADVLLIKRQPRPNPKA